MEPVQNVIVMSGFVGAFFWLAASSVAAFERSPKKVSYVLTGLCLSVSCLAYGSAFSML